MANVDGDAAPLNPELVRILTAEIDWLSDQQTQAMERAASIGMTGDEAEEYDRRGDRIAELVRALSTITERGQMRMKRQKLKGRVKKLIRPRDPSEPEKAQIDIEEADDLYREIRVPNVLADGQGDYAALAP